MFPKKSEKIIESIIRIFFLTLFMTAIVTYRKMGFDANYFINWMKTWGMVAVVAYAFMCFLVRPFILDKFKFEGKKRQIIGMLLLVILFSFIFSYRFGSLYIVTILKNFGILLIIVFPVGMFIAGPLAKITKKFFTTK